MLFPLLLTTFRTLRALREGLLVHACHAPGISSFFLRAIASAHSADWYWPGPHSSGHVSPPATRGVRARVFFLSFFLSFSAALTCFLRLADPCAGRNGVNLLPLRQGRKVSKKKKRKNSELGFFFFLDRALFSSHSAREGRHRRRTKSLTLLMRGSKERAVCNNILKKQSIKKKEEKEKIKHGPCFIFLGCPSLSQ